MLDMKDSPTNTNAISWLSGLSNMRLLLSSMSKANCLAAFQTEPVSPNVSNAVDR